MLELLFQGFVEWLYGLVLECWEYFASVLFDLMSLDFAYLREHIPIRDTIRQIMDYYAKYRRNMAGMRLALEKLALVESYTDRVVATNNHELMRLHEAFDLLELCRAHLEACLQRKESGRGMYQLSDYPEKDPELAKGLVLTRKDGAFQFGWTE